MHTAEEIFGPSGRALAASDLADPQTPMHRTFATTDVRDEPPDNPLRALADPQGSAIFWVALAALLGLILVTGELKVQAALGGRAGRR